MPSPSDPYSRLQYRRLIAWPARIEREWPLLREVFRSAPSKRLLDLGCGTGEHARFLGDKGFEVVGVDRSEKQLEEARREAVPNVRFLTGDLATVAEIDGLADGDRAFDGAICLGNTLPHLTESDEVARMAAGLRRLVRPDGVLLIQILNYERILENNERHLPINFRPQDGGGELVFLRLMQPEADGYVVFCPTSLRFRPDSKTPVEVVSSRRVRLRGWRRDELVEVFTQAGFDRNEVYGGFDRQAYDPHTSRDLVLILGAR